MNAAAPMRVLLVSKGLDIGGIERIVVDLAIGLRQRGVAVDVAVVNDRRDRLAERLEKAGVPLIGLRGHDRIGVRATARLARRIRHGGYDIVHVHGPLPAVVARCTPSRALVVTTSHTMWGALRRSTRLLWGLTARRDAASLAVSSAVRQSLPRRISERTAVVPHGVDVGAVDEVRHGVPRRSEADAVTAICVASHRDVKNYPNLLRAIATARREVLDLRLVAVGEGPDLATHVELASALGISDAVEFRPPTAQVLELMAAADLLVVASDFEGQPLVVMEAMALGLPVVATAVGRVPELISPSEGRIVPPNDSGALAAGIVEMAVDAGLRDALGARARVVARSWTLDHVVDAHVALYRRLLA